MSRGIARLACIYVSLALMGLSFGAAIARCMVGDWWQAFLFALLVTANALNAVSASRLPRA